MQSHASPPLGFLAVQVDIHRPPGDPFNPQTWPFPLLHELIPGSPESQIVSKDPYPPSFLDSAVAAGKKLAERGARGIITSCGFLVLAQKELASRIGIPVATSALIQIPSILAILPPGKVVGVLTYDAERLGAAHLQAVDVDPERIRIRGMSVHGHLRAVIQKGVTYDEVLMGKEMVDGAVALVDECRARGEEIGALVLECTQMPPYAEAIQKRVQVPVYDVYSMGLWFYSGLVRQNPAAWTSFG
ncbi:hypothetical protein DM02DRAFT_44840 [Periconia macrospinosa]|uniref:Aspartate/glutamate racemase family protein n=1 Tax=Periconia macrospinosa TaxID=97972 RepID=A0A2V1DL14_9PLEO|nr:hypothetical protein DM02DRAFT_44840 [Periconia macrospinosa]